MDLSEGVSMETTTFFRAGTMCVWCDRPLYDSQAPMAAGGRTWTHARCDQVSAPRCEELVREAVRRVSSRPHVAPEALDEVGRVVADPRSARLAGERIRCWSELLRPACPEVADEVDLLAAPWTEHRPVINRRPRPQIGPLPDPDPNPPR